VSEVYDDSPRATSTNGEAAAWARNDDPLARWALEHLANRRDCCGRYKAIERRTPGKEDAWTAKDIRNLSGFLRAHFRGRSTGDLVGLHASALIDRDGQPPACMSRWGAVDIDLHDGDGADPEVNLIAALSWYERLRALGFQPLLIDSNGRGGYHLIVVFDGPVPTELVFAFLTWLKSDWRDLGLTKEPESFPKQARIEPGGHGNWLRLFGRHHTHDHYSRVWDGSEWLEGEFAIRAILGTTGDSSALIPSEACERPETTSAVEVNGKITSRPRVAADVNGEGGWTVRPGDAFNAATKIQDLLKADDWTHVTTKGDREFWKYPDATHAWSATVGPEGRVYSFGPNGGIPAGKALDPFGYIAHKKHGGDHKATARALFDQGYGERREQETGSKATAVPSANGHNATPAPAPSATPTAPIVFTNFTEEGTGKETRRVALRMEAIAKSLNTITSGWPKRVEERLFLQGPDFQPVYLDSASRLFAWVDTRAPVVWTKGSSFISQERFYEHLRMTVERFEAIETLPHFPVMPGTFYMHRALPSASDKLCTLLDRFHPASPLDRELILSLILSLFWGGGPGCRPAFLVTGPDQDPELGRGVGKSRLVDILSEELAGGYIDVAHGDDMGAVKTRMLSGPKTLKRVARLDNVKTLRFSWSDLEGMITSPTISGHAMYQGEGSRPNTLVWLITLNGATLSKDMAQRVVAIMLGRPSFSPRWEEETRTFIRTHRWEIVAEIGALLSSGARAIDARTRWASWEQAVLSRVATPVACRDEIVARQGVIDDDNAERDLVAEHFAAKLKEHGHRPDEQAVNIPAGTAAEWLSEATRKQYATNAASSYIRGLSIPQLKQDRTKRARLWVWRPTDSDPRLEAIDLGKFA
jgi:hypothetical protein